MKNRFLLFIVTLLFTAISAYAADFRVNGIAYNITSSTAPYTVAVASDSIEYTGDIIIPDSVEFNSINYSVTAIGYYTFSNCVGLKSVIIPNSVTTIGGNAFEDCSSLTSVIIPNSVKDIGSYAFNNCVGLKSVVISSSVTKIEWSTFRACSSLTSIVIPNSVKNIGMYAFFECVNLTSIVIPNSVREIESLAFLRCKSLTSIILPDSITNIGYASFADCNNLTSINIPNSVKLIGRAAFDYCNNLTSINIPNSVTEIEDQTFEGTGLTSITLPNSITSIGDYAFSGCESLTSIIIPNSVTHVGGSAFSCKNLASIYSENPNPIDLYNFYSPSVFSNVNKSTCILYVPKGSKSLYAAAYEWKDFLNIVEKEYTGIQDNVMESVALFPNPTTRFFTIQGLEKETSIQIFDLTGKKVLEQIIQPEEKIDVAEWSKGIYVVKTEGRTAKLVVK